MFFNSESEVGKQVLVEVFDFHVYLLAAASSSFCSLTTESKKALQLHTKFTKTCNSDVISAAKALFLSILHFMLMSEKTLSGNALLPGTDDMYATSLNIFLEVCHFSPTLVCDCTIRSSATIAEENSTYICQCQYRHLNQVTNTHQRDF